MFSFTPQYEDFLADWAATLLTGPGARAVYYVGTSLWVPSDGSSANVRPNFIVRTEDEYWDKFEAEHSGMPVGRARHDFVKELDPAAKQALYIKWHKTGFTPPPLPTDNTWARLYIEEPGTHVRIIDVPASGSWAGPEYLQRIPDGVSVDRIHQESLRRYDPAHHKLEPAAHYWSRDERRVDMR